MYKDLLVSFQEKQWIYMRNFPFLNKIFGKFYIKYKVCTVYISSFKQLNYFLIYLFHNNIIYFILQSEEFI